MELNTFSRYLTSFSELVEASRPTFRRFFWIGSTIYSILLVALGAQLAIEVFAGAIFISIAALAPWYLWVNGRAKGLPIWPMFTLTALWAYALPMLTEHPVVSQFPPEFQLLGAVLVTGFLVLGTLAWLPFVRVLAPAPAFVRVLPLKRGRTLFFLFLIAGLVLTLLSTTGSINTSGNFFSIVRAFALGLSTLSIFYFGYQMGARQLTLTERLLFGGLLIASVIASITSMLLVGGMSMILLAFISYFLGRGRVPWAPLVLTGLVFYFLHAGKIEQRDQYWGEVMWRPVSLSEYPKFFTDWAAHSGQAIADQFNAKKENREKSQAANKIWERSSLMHLLLYIQYSTPAYVPYLNGETYRVIPQLLIPRFFSPEKLGSHYGNNVLAVQYGIMELEDETGTSIGFGLISEAFANFGYLGCVLVALALGAAAGWITRWSMNVPIMSFRFLIGVISLSAAFQVEYTAGVLVSSIFQTTAALTVVAVIFMRLLPIERARRLVPKALAELKLAAEDPTPALPSPAGTH
jgi:O-antigen polysaccharide polymerase Wzy